MSEANPGPAMCSFPDIASLFRATTNNSPRLMREAAELGADGDDQHHAAGIGEIFRMVANSCDVEQTSAAQDVPIEIWAAASLKRKAAPPSSSAIRKQIPAISSPP
jgi:hypothetical protein